MVGRGGGEGCSLETSIVCSQAVQQGFRVRPGKGVGFWSACPGASGAWEALGELQQAPMATAHRASGTPTPERSARAGRKRDGIPWHSPLTKMVKGALYRVFWTAGITRRLQVQHRRQSVLWLHQRLGGKEGSTASDACTEATGLRLEEVE